MNDESSAGARNILSIDASKVEACTLVGRPLDWAVAKAIGREDMAAMVLKYPESNVFCPSSRWIDGGPVLEAHATEIHREAGRWWVANDAHAEAGSTLLAAAMRLVVATRLGPVIEIPAGLAVLMKTIEKLEIATGARARP